MKVKYLKPESSVLPMQAEPYLAGTKNQGASTETPTEGGGIGGEEEPAKSTVWNDEDFDGRIGKWQD
ncbi:MAG: hypothetical protein IJ698_05610 [Prevotella sp.]|nr:hypothetical protein [Prevotella sp.]